MAHEVIINDVAGYYLESEVKPEVRNFYQKKDRKYGTFHFVDFVKQKDGNKYVKPDHPTLKKYINLVAEDALERTGKDVEWEIVTVDGVAVFETRSIYVFSEIPTEPVSMSTLNAHRKTLYSVCVGKIKRET